MLILESSFNICNTVGFLRIMYLVKFAFNFVRFAIPIILIIMTTLDLLKNVINPKDNEGIKKITNRAIAAVIVFFVPTIVNLVVYFIDYIFESDTGDYKITSCYTNGNSNCIKNLNNYFSCADLSSNALIKEKQACKEYRSCNNYTLNNSCRITTKENPDCNINKDDSVSNYSVTDFYYNID